MKTIKVRFELIATQNEPHTTNGSYQEVKVEDNATIDEVEQIIQSKYNKWVASQTTGGWEILPD